MDKRKLQRLFDYMEGDLWSMGHEAWIRDDLAADEWEEMQKYLKKITKEFQEELEK